MAPASDAPERIWVRLPNWVGDAVMAVPTLRALRQAHPAAAIAIEGPAAFEGLLRGLRWFDRFEASPPRGAAGIATGFRRLRAGRFDWAVLLPDSPRAGLAPYLAGIPRRVGYARDPLRRRLLTDPIPPPQSGGHRLPIPMTERYLAIARRLCGTPGGDGLELVVDPRAAERVDATLRRIGAAPGTPLAVVTPGAGFGPSKLWPAAHFAAACDGLVRRAGLLPVLAPGPLEIGLAERVARLATERCAVIADPPADLAELVALVARARLVLSNDTGPRQIATALGTPAVVLMGPTDPRHTAVHLARQRVLREDVACSPCARRVCPLDHRCLVRLRPERAVAAALELLA